MTDNRAIDQSIGLASLAESSVSKVNAQEIAASAAPAEDFITLRHCISQSKTAASRRVGAFRPNSNMPPNMLLLEA